jgi:hypothetical protein
MPIFKRKHLNLILQGKKTQTRRISRYRLKIGKAYAIRSKMLEPAKTRITITRAWRQQLRDLTPEDVHKEGFNSFTEFRQAWIDIYGSWNPDQIVAAYEFRLLTQKQKYRSRRNRKQEEKQS